jgi:alkanesulfonate monooxygenase SsuD/methylene tetrahydromethanopterin reductase-like flavin-dependent oxidoreductase (luciferase family)
MAVRVVCAETASEARRIASSFALQRLRMEQGHLGRVPSVNDALAYPYSEAELARVEAILAQGFVGDPSEVKERLTDLAASLQIDELVVVTITHDPVARRRSYELLAEAFELSRNHAASSPSAAAK